MAGSRAQFRQIPNHEAAMIYRPICVVIALATIALFKTGAKAAEPKEVRTEKNKAVLLGNLLSTPNNCGTNPGPIPLPKLREKPSHGVVGLVKIRSIALGIGLVAGRDLEEFRI